MQLAWKEAHNYRKHLGDMNVAVSWTTLSTKVQFQSLHVTNEEINRRTRKGNISKVTKRCSRKIETRYKNSKILTQVPFHYIPYIRNPKNISSSFIVIKS